ncbi:hypothetical protein BLNAU_21068 [Blattamonas nauphoetae]|uniref:Uncharacterized protein n=1 Tax=Blattamonas nauphoetae TaxID=2049346 RepID=A0ABQ9X150_9EUKA|nr:hypothetical protein BLNAU_21068 [Blattamonas nauphoetae]
MGDIKRGNPHIVITSLKSRSEPFKLLIPRTNHSALPALQTTLLCPPSKPFCSARPPNHSALPALQTTLLCPPCKSL